MESTNREIAGYANLAWVHDETGREYSCSLDTVRTVHALDDLSDHEQKSCIDVSSIVGTERW